MLIVGIIESATYFLIGAVLTAVSVIRWRQAKSTYTILLGTAGNELTALVSEDANYVVRVARAIDQALIAGR